VAVLLITVVDCMHLHYFAIRQITLQFVMGCIYTYHSKLSRLSIKGSHWKNILKMGITKKF